MKTPLRLLIGLLSLSIPSVALAADDEPPVPVRTVAPEYPTDMEVSRTSGVVTINCEIDEKGTVNSPTVAKTTNAAFNQPALDAVSKWKFRPAKKAGQVVSVRISIPIKFAAAD